MECDEYHGWRIATDYSGDVTFPRQAVGVSPDGQQTLCAVDQTDVEAVFKLQRQIDLRESMGS